MTLEMPWVVETRLAPGEKPKRNPVWGILAAVAATLNAIMFLIVAGLMFIGFGDVALWLYPVWGIVVLGGIGLSVSSLVHRGNVNVWLGIAALAVIAVTNPLIPLVVVSALGG